MQVTRQHLWLGAGIALLLLLQYRIWLDDSGVLASQDLQRQIHAMELENAVLADQNQQYQRDIDSLRNNTDLLEEKAREDLGLVTDGETLIIFVDPPQ